LQQRENGRFVEKIVDWDVILAERAVKLAAREAAKFWNPERVQRLRDLWAADLLAIDIGKKLGCTKNAVLGKADRLGLPRRDHTAFAPKHNLMQGRRRAA
jgi:hypothetical protein